MKNLFKKFIVRYLSGWFLIKEGRIQEILLSRYYKKVFKNIQIDLVVDVGANIGQYRDFLRKRVRYSGEIASIEPDARCYELLLKRKKNDNGWHIYKNIISSKTGFEILKQMNSSPMNSLMEPIYDTKYSALQKVINEIRINSFTMDDYIDSLYNQGLINRESKIVLKIDVQGAEHLVLSGLKRYLGNVAILQVEVSSVPLYKDSMAHYEISKRVEELGFVLSYIPPPPDDQFPIVFDYDVIYVNKELAGS
jgi:FkbM family methyltransferase